MDIGEKHADHNGYPAGPEWVFEWNGKSVYTLAFLDEESTVLEANCHEQLLLHEYRGMYDMYVLCKEL
eukprot:6266600-Prorocentrum_lima.AAC.1